MSPTARGGSRTRPRSTRPRRRDSLTAEHFEALRRVISAPYVVLPEQESEHAYVRRADGTIYICPWQTRLRCLLGYGQMVSAAGTLLPGTIPPADDDQAVADALARLEAGPAGSSGHPAGSSGPPARLHILGSVWTVPLAWFVPFAAAERWLSLGPGPGRASAAATASATRALVYTTPMARARRRVARGLATLRNLPPGFGESALEPRGSRGRPGRRSAAGWRSFTRTRWSSSTTAASCTWSATTGSAGISRWPRSGPPSTGPPGANASLPWPCICVRTAGGAHSLNSSRRTESPG